MGMKRYMVFSRHDFYPNQGIRNFVHDFDTKEEAKNYVNSENFNKIFCSDCTWCQIVDIDSGEFVEYRSGNFMLDGIREWRDETSNKMEQRTSEDILYWTSKY